VNKHKDDTIRECAALKLPEMSCAQPNVLVYGSPTFLWQWAARGKVMSAIPNCLNFCVFLWYTQDL